MLGQQLFLNCNQLAMDLKTWQKSAKILSENQLAIWNYKKKRHIYFVIICQFCVMHLCISKTYNKLM